MYRHPTDPDAPHDTERQRQPYIQIDAALWAVKRHPTDHPVAMTRLITHSQQLPEYLVLTWHPEPHRRLVTMHDTLEEGNRSVFWDNPASKLANLRDDKKYANYPHMGYPERSHPSAKLADHKPARRQGPD